MNARAHLVGPLPLAACAVACRKYVQPRRTPSCTSSCRCFLLNRAQLPSNEAGIVSSCASDGPATTNIIRSDVTKGSLK